MCNVLVVVPHGSPEASTNMEILGYELAELLDSWAVINNRAVSKFDRDLHDFDQAQQVPEYFAGIKDFLTTTRLLAPKSILIFLYGRDWWFDARHPGGKGPVMTVAIGYGPESDPKMASASEAFLDDLWACLKKVKLSSAMPQLGYRGDRDLAWQLKTSQGINERVEAVQIWIRSKGCRDTPANISETAKVLGDLIRSLPDFVTIAPEPVPKKGQPKPSVKADKPGTIKIKAKPRSTKKGEKKRK